MVLDSEMKRLQALGIGAVQRKAEPITFEDEEILWSKRILGDNTPQSLLDTMLYMNAWTIFYSTWRKRTQKSATQTITAGFI